MNSEPVDVLGVIDDAITSAESDYVPEPVDIRNMHKARTVIAELLAADREYDEADRAVRDAKYSTGKHHWKPLPKSSPILERWRVAKDRRAAILAAIKGVSNDQ